MASTPAQTSLKTTPSTSPASPWRYELFLVVPVPCRNVGGNLLLEDQAASGIEAWCRNFHSVAVAMPTLPENLAPDRTTWTWRPANALAVNDPPTLIPLPWAYPPRAYLQIRKTVRKQLRHYIRQSQYCQFAISGWIGDWACDAARIAIRDNIPFAIHTDRPAAQGLIEDNRHRSLLRRARARFEAGVIRKMHHRITRHTQLSLCHGADSMQVYGPAAQHAYIIHDVHADQTDRPSEAAQHHKQTRALENKPLRIVYAGRIEPIKGPLQWVETLKLLKHNGVAFEATWMGHGSAAAQMRQAVTDAALDDCIDLPGAIHDRQRLMHNLRNADLFLFNHLSPESPRCLIETLIAGTPMLGYHSHYAADLLKDHQAGQLTPLGQPKPLADALTKLDKDRRQLAHYMQEAYHAGAQFTRDAVFAHRSQLIRKHLLPALPLHPELISDQPAPTAMR